MKREIYGLKDVTQAAYSSDETPVLACRMSLQGKVDEIFYSDAEMEEYQQLLQGWEGCAAGLDEAAGFCRAQFERTLSSGEKQVFQLRMGKRDYHVSYLPKIDAAGRILSIAAVVRDISQQQLASQLYSRSTYLNRLLVNDYPVEYVNKALSEFGIEHNTAYCCFLIRIYEKTEKASVQPAAKLGGRASAIQESLIWLADQGLEWVWKCNDDLVLLLPLSEENIKDKAGQILFSEKTAQMISARLPDMYACIGISGCSELPLNIREVYQKARQSVVVASLENKCSIMHFEDIGLYEIAFQMLKDHNITSLVQNTVGRLAEYDRMRAGNMLLTLKSILEDGNLKIVAQKMFIHHNTAIWRKRRIEKLLGLSLDNTETQVLLMLHMKIWELQRLENDK